jgi:hypothetical protein
MDKNRVKVIDVKTIGLCTVNRHFGQPFIANGHQILF